MRPRVHVAALLSCHACLLCGTLGRVLEELDSPVPEAIACQACQGQVRKVAPQDCSWYLPQTWSDAYTSMRPLFWARYSTVAGQTASACAAVHCITASHRPCSNCLSVE